VNDLVFLVPWQDIVLDKMTKNDTLHSELRPHKMVSIKRSEKKQGSCLETWIAEQEKPWCKQ